MEDKKVENSEETKNSPEIIEEKSNKRRDKILNWIRDPNNFIFLAFFILIIGIRLYYFLLTKNQPLWWDESQYMSGAKSIAGLVEYDLGGPRTPLLSMVMSIFFFLNITSEPVMRFIALLIPALIVIALTYFCIREMYDDKRIALISILIIGILWEHIFYSNRFHTENFSLIFLFLAVLVLFRCYMKKQDLFFIKPKYSLLWIIIFSVISVLFRAGNVIVLPILVLFILILNKDKLLFTKKGRIILFFIIFLGILSLIIVPRLSFAKTYLDIFYMPNNPIAWNNLNVFYGFYQSVIANVPSIFFYFFLAGIIIFLIDLILGYERLKKISMGKENLTLKSDIFNFLIIVFVLFNFMFLIRVTSFEYRWFFPLLLGMLAFTGKGIINVIEYVSSLVSLKNKKIILAIIMIIVAIGVYNQFVHSDGLIKNKVSSYLQVKEAGIWIKENSDKSDIIISASHPQTTYYAERKVETFYVNGTNENESAFNEHIKLIKPKFIEVSIFETGFTPQWAYDWPNRNNNSVTPVMGYFLDEQKTQLALVIYTVDYDKFQVQVSGKKENINQSSIRKIEKLGNITSNKTI